MPTAKKKAAVKKPARKKAQSPVKTTGSALLPVTSASTTVPVTTPVATFSAQKQVFQQYTTHVVMIIDKSGSMSGQPVEQVFDGIIHTLKSKSIELEQEVRISIYMFDSNVRNTCYDMDVMRFQSLKGHFHPEGATALLDAVSMGIKEHMKIPTPYGDHAFVVYLITDGEENQSRNTNKNDLKALLTGMPDNWTVACQVPDERARLQAQSFGFHAGCIETWEANGSNKSAALTKAVTNASNSIINLMQNRKLGIRNSTNFFQMDSSSVKKSDLDRVDPSTYNVFTVRKDGRIDDTVRSWTGREYVTGSTYYQPVKKVIIQDYKNILLQDVATGQVYTSQDIRTLLGLPSQTATIDPGHHTKWRIFVQSTSSNRKLFKDTFIIVMNP